MLVAARGISAAPPQRSRNNIGICTRTVAIRSARSACAHSTVVTLAGRFLGAGEGAAHHDGIRAAGERFANVPAFAHASVGDDGYILARFLEMHIPRGGAIHRGGDLWDAQAKNAATSA